MAELRDEYKEMFVRFLGVNSFLIDGLIWLTAIALFCVVPIKAVQLCMLAVISASLSSFIINKPKILLALEGGNNGKVLFFLELLNRFFECVARGALSVGILLLAWKIIYV